MINGDCQVLWSRQHLSDLAWIRTSDLKSVERELSHCATQPSCVLDDVRTDINGLTSRYNNIICVDMLCSPAEPYPPPPPPPPRKQRGRVIYYSTCRYHQNCCWYPSIITIVPVACVCVCVSARLSLSPSPCQPVPLSHPHPPSIDPITWVRLAGVVTLCAEPLSALSADDLSIYGTVYFIAEHDNNLPFFEDSNDPIKYFSQLVQQSHNLRWIFLRDLKFVYIINPI